MKSLINKTVRSEYVMYFQVAYLLLRFDKTTDCKMMM